MGTRKGARRADGGAHSLEGMATVELTEDTFESTVLGDGIVLVDFWADWCGPCKAFAPIYDQSANDNADIVFGKVDPTLMIFRDGIGVFAQAGALPKPALDDVIAQARALDMDAIREEIKQQQEQQGGAAAEA
jgi:thioredoxin 1